MEILSCLMSSGITERQLAYQTASIFSSAYEINRGERELHVLKGYVDLSWSLCTAQVAQRRKQTPIVSAIGNDDIGLHDSFVTGHTDTGGYYYYYYYQFSR